ncbi:MAG: hypothetical protein KAT00_01400 [Planctomycetes bacterium]|nr:hypothetical protein [Planctomycetota bacterium]
MKRINLTQHGASPDQGCKERSTQQVEQIQKLLTFDKIPTLHEITDRALALANIAFENEADEAMIGGAPYLILALDLALRFKGIKPVYAFSKREVEEVAQADGSVKKTSRFHHLGFVRF